jgi:hypothetical protein
MTDQDTVPEEISEDVAAIWAEITEAETPPADDQPSDQDRPSEEPEGEDKDPDEGSKEPEGEGDKPAAPEASGNQDPLATADPKVKETVGQLQSQLTQLQQQLHSERGRHSALQRKLAALGPAEPKKDERLKKVAEEYPEVAQPIIDEIDALKAEFNERKLAEFQRQVVVESAKVTVKHPDYISVLQKHAGEFQAWVEDPRQPAWVKPAFDRNAAEVVDAAEVLPIITAFYRHKGLLKDEGTSSPAPQGQGSSPNLSDKRKRQLAGSVGPSSRTQPAALSGIPEEGDEQEIWEAIVREDKRKQR